MEGTPQALKFGENFVEMQAKYKEQKSMKTKPGVFHPSSFIFAESLHLWPILTNCIFALIDLKGKNPTRMTSPHVITH